MIAFLHQHEVRGRQGGIERYLETLLDVECGASMLVALSEETSNTPSRLFIKDLLPQNLPSWFKYTVSALFQVRAIKARFEQEGVCVAELSRPEYIVFASLLGVRTVVTIHGTGPTKRRLAAFLTHHFFAFLCSVLVHEVQIVGFDSSGLSRLAKWIARSKIRHIHAWADDVFVYKPIQARTDRFLNILYAGRLSEQKDPGLLFDIIRHTSIIAPEYKFHYCGADYDVITSHGLSSLVTNHGMLNSRELSNVISASDLTVLTSSHGEGSPFIVIETLASGRFCVLSDLPTLRDAYATKPGVLLVEERTPEAYVAAFSKINQAIDAGDDGARISEAVSDRKKSVMARRHIDHLKSLVGTLADKKRARIASDSDEK